MNQKLSSRHLILILVLISLNLYSSGYGQDLPQIIPPSPTAKNFMRYGEIPVDYSTGVPNIDIPIYTLEGRKLTLPISISYHASGIKVNDIASEVGLGWTLNCGGMVSVSINGKRDMGAVPIRTFFTGTELIDSLMEVAPLENSTGTTLVGLMNFERFLTGDFVDVEDSMNDRYFYKLPNGTSGIFTYSYYDIERDTVVSMPYRPLKIEKLMIEGNWRGFRITDNNGIIHIFKMAHLGYGASSYSEWLLSEMVSADGTEKIKFYYKPQSAITYATRSQTYFGSEEDGDLNCYSLNPNASLGTFHSPIQQFNTPVLDSIVSSNTIVRFKYGDREDFDYSKRLVSISIAPKQSPTDTIRKIQFVEKYFGTTPANKRLGLDYITIKAPGDSESQKYAFYYESQVLPPYPMKIESAMYNEDFWGYNNGKNSGSMVPKDFITNPIHKTAYGGNRDPDVTGNYAKACMLREIRYPAGGRTVFHFERHYAENVYPYKIYSEDRDGYVGGFRVASITNYDEYNEIASLKTYEYKYPKIKPIQKNYFRYEQRYLEPGSFHGAQCNVDYLREIVLSSPLLPLEVAPGLPIMYGEVVEYNGTKINNVGKTVYKYSHPYSPSGSVNNEPFYFHSNHYDNGNYVPQLISKARYSFDGINYHPVSKEGYEYTKLSIAEFNTGIKLSRPRIYGKPEYFEFLGCLVVECDLTPEINLYIESTVALDTKAYQEASLLTNSEVYTFDPHDSTKYALVSTDYSYNENTLAVKKKWKRTSNDDLLTSTYKYPHDFQSEEPYSSMVDKHVYTPVIEQSDYNESQSKQINKVITEYKDWGNGLIEPEIIKVQGASGPMESRINYLAYDSYGNPTCIQKDNDKRITYLWGYNRSYPIAEILNSGYHSFLFIHGSGTFDYNGMMNSGQHYSLNGSCTFTQGVNATIRRNYYKLDDHQTTFTLYIFDASHHLIKTLSDVMDENKTELTVSSQVHLPPGQYTVEVSATYMGTGLSYQHDVQVFMDGYAESTLPFHTSFEEDNNQVNNIEPRTGNKCHVGNYILALPPSSSGYNQVVVSYWGKTSETSEWMYNEELVNTNHATKIIGAGYAFIDEVRMYPVGAQMTTYTHKPLTGITSQTDPNGVTSFYDYDNAGRLISVKDYKGNMVKTYDYHYRK